MAADERRTALLRRIRNLAARGHDALPDRELLARFACRGDQAAFEAVVRRHGPLVLGVGRRVLGNTHDAEEVFQATFLTLARKAASPRWSESIGPWLGEVARRLALEARAKAARRRDKEAAGPRRPASDPAADVSLREVQAVLEEELGRLPQRCRVPLLLCCVEGQSRDEAAGQLGVSLGTLKRRLDEGRRLLQARLGRRGVTLTSALLAAELCRRPAAAVPPALLISTTRSAVEALAGPEAASGSAFAAANAVSAAIGPRLAAVAAAVLTASLLAAAGLLAPTGAGPRQAAGTEEYAVPAAPKPAEPPGGGLPPGVLFRLGAAGLRHGARIIGSALSPNGRLLATASGWSVAVWDIAARKRLRLFPCDRWPHYSTPKLAFSPDGNQLGYVHSGSFACVWDLATGKEVRRFQVENTWYSSCQFTPDGKEFALCEREQVCFWDLQSGRVIRSFRTEHPARLSAGARVFFCPSNGKLVLGDARTGKERLSVEAGALDDGIENGIAISPDGKALATVERHKRVQVREVEGGRLLASFPLPESAGYTYRGHAYWEYQIGFSADGRTVLLATRGGLVHRWDLATGKELPALEKHPGGATAAHAPAGGRTVVSTGNDGVFRVWDAATGREMTEQTSTVGRTHAACSPRGNLAAVADAQGRVDLWDAAAGKRLRALSRRGPAVTGLAFAPDGKTLAAAGEDGKVRFWDVASGREGKALVAEGQALSYVLTLAFSPDGRALCPIDGQYKLRLYDLATGKVRWRGYSACAAFSPDGGALAASDGAISVGSRFPTDLAILDAATGRATTKAPVRDGAGSHHNGLTAVSFAPGGRLVAAAAPGRTVCLCDARTGDEVRRFQAAFPHTGTDRLFELEIKARGAVRVNALAFSPDGRLLVSCGSDGAVRLWEVATGQWVLERRGHEGDVPYAAFSADGRSVLSCGEDGQVLLWGIRPAETGATPTLDALWESLGAEKAEDAYRAVWGMSQAASAAAFLGRKIPPVEPASNARIEKLIGELGSDQFPAREAATRELEKLGERAAGALRQALEAGAGPEARRRINRLLDALKRAPSPAELRESRAVQALELAATAEARELLREWARGAHGPRLAGEAKSALKRSEGRGGSSP